MVGRDNILCSNLFPFQVEVRASDHGIPPRTATARARIRITRDQNFPVFNQTEYTVRLPENTPVRTRIITVGASDKDVSPILIYLLYYSVIHFLLVFDKHVT